MSPERWVRIEDIFHEATALDASARVSFLDSSCGSDQDLREEVESLLRRELEANDFLELHCQTTTQTDMPLPAQVGPYRLKSRLGAGGMGEVYRAHDSKLGRDVALKTLPREFAAHAERLARFRREARLLAALNHPNIAGIYGLEESEGCTFLVLELAEGESLRGPLPVEQALEYARQLAEALEAAHTQGIVHRDLKPANVKITPQGRVKVLDFGLAKALWQTSEQPDPLLGQTATSVDTASGQIAGTPSYMSPEQARGGAVDQRTDVWAFGCVLYELLTGKRAFAGNTLAESVDAVLQLEPDWAALPPKTPPRVKALIRQCLDKDATRRPQEIRQVRSALEQALRSIRSSIAAAVSTTGEVLVRTRRAWAGFAIVAVLGASAVVFQRLHSGGSPSIRSIVVLPLKNLSRGPDQDFLASGFTELLTSELGKTMPIRVTSPASARSAGDALRAPASIARQLNVDALVTGSVVRSDDRVRVTAELTLAASGEKLWSKTFDRNVTDVLLLQQELALAVAHEIRADVLPSSRAAARINRDAFESFLRARYFLDQRSDPDIRKAMEWFQKAIDADPAYAAPYAGLADCYNQLGTTVIGSRSPRETRSLAAAAARRALEIDPNLAEAHAALAYCDLYDWNWALAEQGFLRAIQANPNYAPAHLWFAHYLTSRKQFDRAFQEVRLARDLDPLSPVIRTQVGWLLAYAGRHAEAIQEFRDVLESHADYQWALWRLGNSQMSMHDYSSGIATLERAVQVSKRSPSTLGSLGRAYALTGRRREAQKILDELLSMLDRRYVSPKSIATVYEGLEDLDKMFEWLEKCYQERGNAMIWLNLERPENRWHSDPRFQDLVRRVGLN